MITVSNDFKTRTKKIKQQNIKLGIVDGELTVKEVHFMTVKQFNALPVWMLRKRQEVIAKELKYSFEGNLFKTIMKQIEITVKNAGELKDKNINFQYGIYVNNDFEYIDLGDYYIKDVEDDKGKTELVVTGYDKMIHFMKTFKQSELQLTYPCTMLTLIQKMCEVCEVELYSTNFFNADLQVDEDYFTAQELTYRDVLEKVAESTETTIFIKDNKLYLHKLSDESVEKLDASYLTGLTIKEKFGPVNALVLGRGDVEDNVESRDDTSIAQNGRCEIRFDENEFVEYQREQVIDEMFEQIKGLEYYSFEGSDVGVMWLEPCDLIEVEDREESKYKTIYLSANITINTGISSDIEADIPEETNTEYKVTTKEEKKTLKVERLAKKNEGLIQDLIEENTETSQKLTQVEQTVGQIQQQVSSIEEFSREITGTNEIYLEDTVAGEEYLLNFKIKGDSDKFIYLTPSDTLTSSYTLVPLGDHFTLISDKQNRDEISDEAQIIDILLSEPLRSLDDVYDELNIINGKATVIRRIGVNENLELYELENEVVENLQDITLKTFNEDTYIYIKEYEGLEYTAKYIIKNDYIDVLATKFEMNSAITQTANSITLEVDKKLTNTANDLENQITTLNSTFTQTAENITLEVSKKVGNDEIISKINQSSESIEIQANKLNLNGSITANGNFKIDTEGNMQCKDATMEDSYMDNITIKSMTAEDGSFYFQSNGKMYAKAIEVQTDRPNAGSFVIRNTETNNEILATPSSLHIQDKSGASAIIFTAEFSSDEHEGFGYIRGTLQIDGPNSDITCERNIFSESGNIYASNGNMYANQFVNWSKKEKKENIIKLNNTKRKALDIVKQTDICEYNFKGSKHKQIGAVLGEGYSIPNELLSEDKSGIDLYSMISNLYRAFQEYIEEQEEKINKLEEKVKNYEMDKENTKKANQNSD